MVYNPYYYQPFTPTIRTEIVQVENEEAARNYPVGIGASQMMIARDDSAIFVKTSLQNGQYNMDVFVKRPPAPEKPPFNPAEYVRKDEIAAIIAELRKEENHESV